MPQPGGFRPSIESRVASAARATGTDRRLVGSPLSPAKRLEVLHDQNGKQ